MRIRLRNEQKSVQTRREWEREREKAKLSDCVEQCFLYSFHSIVNNILRSVEKLKLVNAHLNKIGIGWCLSRYRSSKLFISKKKMLDKCFQKGTSCNVNLYHSFLFLSCLLLSSSNQCLQRNFRAFNTRSPCIRNQIIRNWHKGEIFLIQR